MIEESISVSEWDGIELLQERAGAIGRTGARLNRILTEMTDLERELDRMSLTLHLPGLSLEVREDIRAEMDLSISEYNHLRQAAAEAYRQLIHQRESCGFRGHELVQQCFPIPDLLLTSDVPDYLDC
jgi:hypothetical protein